MRFPDRNSFRANCDFRISRVVATFVVAIICCQSLQAQAEPQQAVSSNRVTPLVRAVANARPAVVNLRGRKTLRPNKDVGTRTQAVRQVNGMGTGVIIDPAGYILTNFHVVEDVKRIQVTLADGESTVGQLIAHDDKTDLALIKIDTDRPLTTIPLGVSTDVMLAETVAALGNAYGYEDTVTRGIVSEIGRTVQVSEEQIYHNLLQTDAPINPGNSGGPLINLDGEMIGINVAVRVGAQGIAFAIPVNDAMEVASEFIGKMTERRVNHGIVAQTVYTNHEPSTRIQAVSDFSAAEKAGLKYGDIVRSINGAVCDRAIDLQRALLAAKMGDEVEIHIERNGEPMKVAMSLGRSPESVGMTIWKQFGAKVSPVDQSVFGDQRPDYTHGLRIEQIRTGGPADVKGLMPGDVLVTMDGWKTESIENLQYILNQEEVQKGTETVFFIIRNGEAFYGNIRMATR